MENASSDDRDDAATASATPFVRERAGVDILFGARLRSQIAKRKGDALNDLKDRDCDNALVSRFRSH